MQKPSPHARKTPVDKTAGKPPKFQKPESVKLAMDESTIGSLLALRRKATPLEFDIDDALFASLLKNPNAAVATMRIAGKLEGYIVATPINEGWVKGDIQEIKDMMMTKPGMDPGLFEKISKAIDSGPFYYLDDFQMAKREDALLGMVENFYSQLDSNSAKFIAVHGLFEGKQYKIYSSMIKSGGFVKIHENVHSNWFGGKDFIFMVFEKA